ncbi:helix-turn-helix domain-containing protein [Actinomadura sp. ATCC 31491]|uniref:Helix-turn-helix domain-containing protein n=1 Tax=Actinomadura luzonensis TaxID=2805427 RepID=A0ABT0FQG3_9ACTN|nr:helix-turn-helix transcriptional regulator [Actinomadura luzonensis]MCK2214245.1 helix-turn-helix domain-containing protein [Actinomadura luzonensis]
MLVSVISANLCLYLTVSNWTAREHRLMAREVPAATREGALIRSARKSTPERLTIPQAAEKAGISAETWGHMERGHKPVGRGQPPAPYVAQADVVARAARVVGLTSDELRKVDRPDAAEALARMLRDPHDDEQLEVLKIETRRGRVWFEVRPDLEESRRELLRAWGEEMAETLYQQQLAADHQDKPADK